MDDITLILIKLDIEEIYIPYLEAPGITLLSSLVLLQPALQSVDVASTGAATSSNHPC